MACRAAEVPYERLLRGKSAELDDAILVESAAQAAEILAGVTGNVLITTGSKELQAYAALPRERLYPRVLPSGESLAACEAIEIPHRNIIAMQGPFTKELNAALIRQFHIVWLVTKDGGQAGGFAEKVQAVRETGIRLIVLCRPQEQGKSFAEIVEICEEMMRCR